MATVATINEKVTAAVTAIESADWDTALTKLYAAKALLATLPSRTAKEGVELEYDAAAIDSLIDSINRQRVASVGLQSTEIVYARTPPDDEDC